MTKSLQIFIYCSCQRKKKYSFLKDALIKLLEVQNKGHTVNSCYKCVVCGHWHIGHYAQNSYKKSRQNWKLKQYLKYRKEVLCQ